MTLTFAKTTLDDKYILDSGRVYLSGIQALVRLPMIQRRRHLAAGLNTAGFISGYRGSPLGVYAQAPQQIRGFGHVKEKAIIRAKANEAALLDAFRSGITQLATAAE